MDWLPSDWVLVDRSMIWTMEYTADWPSESASTIPISTATRFRLGTARS